MDYDLHLNFPGELALVLDEIVVYQKLLEPVTLVPASNTAVLVANAIFMYRDYCRQCCEIYGVLPVKEEK